jgi:hypothetical protein
MEGKRIELVLGEQELKIFELGSFMTRLLVSAQNGAQSKIYFCTTAIWWCGLSGRKDLGSELLAGRTYMSTPQPSSDQKLFAIAKTPHTDRQTSKNIPSPKHRG